MGLSMAIAGVALVVLIVLFVSKSLTQIGAIGIAGGLVLFQIVWLTTGDNGAAVLAAVFIPLTIGTLISAVRGD